jgi:hypothetical protein
MLTVPQADPLKFRLRRSELGRTNPVKSFLLPTLLR